MSNTTNNPEENNFSFDQNRKNPFAMPEGYLDAFTKKINNRIELEEELKEFPILSAVSKAPVFSIPKKYFSKNESVLDHLYESQTYTVLNKIVKPELKSIYPDYFETLAHAVSKQIEITDELKEYSALYSIDKQNSFVVTPGYFDNIADGVKDRYHATKKENISLFEKIFDYILKPKVVFAYSLTLIIGIGSFLYFNQPASFINSGDCKTLACLEKRELLNEQSMNKFSDDDLYELVDVEELNKQLSGEMKTPDSINDKTAQHSH